MQNEIQVQSLKRYAPEHLIKELKKNNFPSYIIFPSAM